MHFGSLMELCHEKHSELPESQRAYKGRVVFRGDQVRDESGFYAVFSEQGTSASHLAAAKFIDAIARFEARSRPRMSHSGLILDHPEAILDHSGSILDGSVGAFQP